MFFLISVIIPYTIDTIHKDIIIKFRYPVVKYESIPFCVSAIIFAWLKLVSAIGPSIKPNTIGAAVKPNFDKKKRSKN